MTAIAFCLALAGGDLHELAQRHHFTWTHDARTGLHVVRAGEITLSFTPGLKTARVLGEPRKLMAPPRVVGGRVTVPAELASLIAKHAKPPVVKPGPFISRRHVVGSGLKIPSHRIPACTITLDAGHGGNVTGGKGRTGLLEKDINLDVTLQLAGILRSWGAKIVMTRTTDRDLPLAARAAMANRTRSDLFVSIHTNWVGNAGPRGYEVFVPQNIAGQRDRESRRLAALIRKGLGLVWRNSPDRGTRDFRNLAVLRQTRCPAALVELEFVSNRWAERELAKDSIRRALAIRIAEAVWQWVVARS